MPFGKGKSGNPRGGLRSYERWADIYSALLARPFGSPPPADETYKERIARSVVEKAARADLAAVHLLMERTEGKVADKVEQSGQVKTVIEVVDGSGA